MSTDKTSTDKTSADTMAADMIATDAMNRSHEWPGTLAGDRSHEWPGTLAGTKKPLMKSATRSIAAIAAAIAIAVGAPSSAYADWENFDADICVEDVSIPVDKLVSDGYVTCDVTSTTGYNAGPYYMRVVMQQLDSDGEWTNVDAGNYGTGNTFVPQDPFNQTSLNNVSYVGQADSGNSGYCMNTKYETWGSTIPIIVGWGNSSWLTGFNQPFAVSSTINEKEYRLVYYLTTNGQYDISAQEPQIEYRYIYYLDTFPNVDNIANTSDATMTVSSTSQSEVEIDWTSLFSDDILSGAKYVRMTLQTLDGSSVSNAQDILSQPEGWTAFDTSTYGYYVNAPTELPSSVSLASGSSLIDYKLVFYVSTSSIYSTNDEQEPEVTASYSIYFSVPFHKVTDADQSQTFKFALSMSPEDKVYRFSPNDDDSDDNSLYLLDGTKEIASVDLDMSVLSKYHQSNSVSPIFIAYFIRKRTTGEVYDGECPITPLYCDGVNGESYEEDNIGWPMKTGSGNAKYNTVSDHRYKAFYIPNTLYWSMALLFKLDASDFDISDYEVVIDLSNNAPEMSNGTITAEPDLEYRLVLSFDIVDFANADDCQTESFTIEVEDSKQATIEWNNLLTGGLSLDGMQYARIEITDLSGNGLNNPLEWVSSIKSTTTNAETDVIGTWTEAPLQCYGWYTSDISTLGDLVITTLKTLAGIKLRLYLSSDSYDNGNKEPLISKCYEVSFATQFQSNTVERTQTQRFIIFSNDDSTGGVYNFSYGGEASTYHYNVLIDLKADQDGNDHRTGTQIALTNLGQFHTDFNNGSISNGVFVSYHMRPAGQTSVANVEMARVLTPTKDGNSPISSPQYSATQDGRYLAYYAKGTSAADPFMFTLDASALPGYDSSCPSKVLENYELVIDLSTEAPVTSGDYILAEPDLSRRIIFQFKVSDFQEQRASYYEFEQNITIHGHVNYFETLVTYHNKVGGLHSENNFSLDVKYVRFYLEKTSDDGSTWERVTDYSRTPLCYEKNPTLSNFKAVNPYDMYYGYYTTAWYDANLDAPLYLDQLRTSGANEWMNYRLVYLIANTSPTVDNGSFITVNSAANYKFTFYFILPNDEWTNEDEATEYTATLRYNLDGATSIPWESIEWEDSDGKTYYLADLLDDDTSSLGSDDSFYGRITWRTCLDESIGQPLTYASISPLTGWTDCKGDVSLYQTVVYDTVLQTETNADGTVKTTVQYLAKKTVNGNYEQEDGADKIYYIEISAEQGTDEFDNEIAAKQNEGYEFQTTSTVTTYGRQQMSGWYNQQATLSNLPSSISAARGRTLDMIWLQLFVHQHSSDSGCDDEQDFGEQEYPIQRVFKIIFEPPFRSTTDIAETKYIYGLYTPDITDNPQAKYTSKYTGNNEMRLSLKTTDGTTLDNVSQEAIYGKTMTFATDEYLYVRFSLRDPITKEEIAGVYNALESTLQTSNYANLKWRDPNFDLDPVPYYYFTVDAGKAKPSFAELFNITVDTSVYPEDKDITAYDLVIDVATSSAKFDYRDAHDSSYTDETYLYTEPTITARFVVSFVSEGYESDKYLRSSYEYTVNIGTNPNYFETELESDYLDDMKDELYDNMPSYVRLYIERLDDTGNYMPIDNSEYDEFLVNEWTVNGTTYKWSECFIQPLAAGYYASWEDNTLPEYLSILNAPFRIPDGVDFRKYRLVYLFSDLEGRKDTDNSLLKAPHIFLRYIYYFTNSDDPFVNISGTAARGFYTYILNDPWATATDISSTAADTGEKLDDNQKGFEETFKAWLESHVADGKTIQYMRVAIADANGDLFDGLDPLDFGSLFMESSELDEDGNVVEMAITDEGSGFYTAPTAALGWYTYLSDKVETDADGNETTVTDTRTLTELISSIQSAATEDWYLSNLHLIFYLSTAVSQEVDPYTGALSMEPQVDYIYTIDFKIGFENSDLDDCTEKTVTRELSSNLDNANYTYVFEYGEKTVDGTTATGLWLSIYNTSDTSLTPKRQLLISDTSSLVGEDAKNSPFYVRYSLQTVVEDNGTEYTVEDHTASGDFANLTEGINLVQTFNKNYNYYSTEIAEDEGKYSLSDALYFTFTGNTMRGKQIQVRVSTNSVETGQTETDPDDETKTRLITEPTPTYLLTIQFTSTTFEEDPIDGLYVEYRNGILQNPTGGSKGTKGRIVTEISLPSYMAESKRLIPYIGGNTSYNRYIRAYIEKYYEETGEWHPISSYNRFKISADCQGWTSLADIEYPGLGYYKYFNTNNSNQCYRFNAEDCINHLFSVSDNWDWDNDNIEDYRVVFLLSDNNLDVGTDITLDGTDATGATVKHEPVAKAMIVYNLTEDFARFVHYQGYGNDTDDPTDYEIIDLANNQVRQKVHEWEYYIYVTPGKSAILYLPLQFMRDFEEDGSNIRTITPSTGLTEFDMDFNFSGGNGIEPIAYFRWYDYNTDFDFSDNRMKPYNASSNPLNNQLFVENGLSRGYFTLCNNFTIGRDYDYHLWNNVININNGGAVVFTAPNDENWTGDIVACDVSRFVDGMDYNMTSLMREPTLSIRYKFIIKPAKEIAEAAKTVLEESDGSTTYEDWGSFFFGTKDMNSVCYLRTRFPDVQYYRFYNYKVNWSQDANGEWMSEPEWDTSEVHIPTHMKWRIYDSSLRYCAHLPSDDDSAPQNGRFCRISVGEVNLNGLSGLNFYPRQYVENHSDDSEPTGVEPVSITFNDHSYCYVVGYASDGEHSCPMVHYTLRFLSDSYPILYEDLDTEAPSRTLEYLQANYTEAAKIDFDNERGYTLDEPTNIYDNLNPYPFTWNRASYGFVYPDLYHWQTGLPYNYQGFAPVHGDYSLMKTMHWLSAEDVFDDYGNVTNFKVKYTIPNDSYTYTARYWNRSGSIHDRTYYLTNGAQHGNFMYIDASDEARPIAECEFEARLCVGSSMIFTAAVADLTSNDVTPKNGIETGHLPPNITFRIYGLDKNNDGTETRHLVHTYTTGDFHTVGATEYAKWYQVYGKIFFRPESNVDQYTRFVVSMVNFCEDTAGADYGVDGIRIYISNGKALVDQEDVQCGNEAAPIKLKVEQQTLMNMLPDDVVAAYQEAYEQGESYTEIETDDSGEPHTVKKYDQSTWYKMYYQIRYVKDDSVVTGIYGTDEDGNDLLYGSAAIPPYTYYNNSEDADTSEDFRHVPIQYLFIKASDITEDNKINDPQNPGTLISLDDYTFELMGPDGETETISLAEAIKQSEDGCLLGYELGDNGYINFVFAYKSFVLDMSETYYVSLYPLTEAYVPDPYDDKDWGNPLEKCSAYSNSFSPLKQQLRLAQVDGEVFTTAYVSCGDEGVTRNFEGQILIPDEKGIYHTYAPADPVKFHWTIVDITPGYGASLSYETGKYTTLEDGTKAYYGIDPSDPESYARAVYIWEKEDGTYVAYGEGEMPISDSVLDSGQWYEPYVSFQFMLGRTYLITAEAMPTIDENGNKTTTKVVVDGSEYSLCDASLEITIGAKLAGPDLSLGFDDVIYPDEYERVVRMGLPQFNDMIDNHSVNNGRTKPMRIPVNETVDKEGDKGGPLLTMGYVYLQSTDDRTQGEYDEYSDRYVVRKPVGRIKGGGSKYRINGDNLFVDIDWTPLETYTHDQITTKVETTTVKDPQRNDDGSLVLDATGQIVYDTVEKIINRYYINKKVLSGITEENGTFKLLYEEKELEVYPDPNFEYLYNDDGSVQYGSDNKKLYDTTLPTNVWHEIAMFQPDCIASSDPHKAHLDEKVYLHEGYEYKMYFEYFDFADRYAHLPEYMESILQQEVNTANSTRSTIEDLGDETAACTDFCYFTVKIVPEYVTWTAGESHNTNWLNDGNWRRTRQEALHKTYGMVDENTGELINELGTNTPNYYNLTYKDYSDKLRTIDSDGQTRSPGYVPMKFTKVTVIADCQACLLGAMATDASGLIQNYCITNQNGHLATDNIQYDMEVMWYGEENAMTVYEMEKFYGNTCEQIYFHPNAELRYQHYLTYERAWVDKELRYNTWTTFTSPLKSTYAGDFYVPQHSGRQSTEAFQRIRFDDMVTSNEHGGQQSATADDAVRNIDLGISASDYLSAHGDMRMYKRTVFPFYQRTWDKNESAFVYMPLSVKAGGYYNAFINYANWDEEGLESQVFVNNWSHTFNNVAYPYEAGHGIAVRTIDPSKEYNYDVNEAEIDSSEKAMLRLPKADTSYEYYSYDGKTDSQTNDDHGLTLDRSGYGKFVTDDANQYSHGMVITPEQNNTKNNAYAFLGNPMMATLDMEQVLTPRREMNTQYQKKYWYVRDGYFHYGCYVDESEDAATGQTIAAHWDYTNDQRQGYVRPMQAFFLKINEELAALDPADRDLEFCVMPEWGVDIYAIENANISRGSSDADTDPSVQSRMLSSVLSHQYELAMSVAGGNTAKVWLRRGAQAGFSDDEDMEVMLDANLRNSVPTVYTVAGSMTVAYNTLPSLDILPVGVMSPTDSLQMVTFAGISHVGELYLFDAETGQSRSVGEGETVEMYGNAHGRYFLTSRAVNLSDDDDDEMSLTGSTDRIFIYNSATGQVTVSAPTAESIDYVRAFDVNGRLLYEQTNIEGSIHTFPLTRSIAIITAQAAESQASVKLRVY